MYGEPLLGKNIRSARDKKGMKQAELAQKSQVSITAISAYENDRKRPGLDTLAALAKALDVSLDELYYGEPSLKPIATSGSEGELIVNCVYELWKLGVLANARRVFLEEMEEARQGLRTDEYYFYDEEPAPEDHIGLSKYASDVERLIYQLDDYADREYAFPDKAAYLEQLLGSFVNKIEVPF